MRARVTSMVEDILQHGTLFGLGDVLNYSTNEYDAKEVIEWWIVTSSLCDELEVQGEMVIPDYNLWGRTTGGQAPYQDDVIQEICKRLHII